MKTTILIPNSSFIIILLMVCTFNAGFSQNKKILVDVAHGQKFYSDPADKISTQLVPTERLAYMTGELTKNASANRASLNYLKTPITAAALEKNDLLFIHAAGTKYTAEECHAISQFIKKGGSLFIVMEEDYWGTLDQLNVNDIVTPFGITFKSNNPTKVSGGHSKPGAITKTTYSIPSHGARLVEGGTPFAFTNTPDETPIGVYKEVDGGGKIVAMGEGMVSLYMNEWQNVKDYQCAGFMEEVIGWLLK
ncbi:MAG TPA: hypothetical protein VGD40_25070 [Chryseosolibacter sp.]